MAWEVYEGPVSATERAITEFLQDAGVGQEYTDTTDAEGRVTRTFDDGMTLTTRTDAEVAARQAAARREPWTPIVSTDQQYVYMIRCHERIKIGRSRNPNHRLKSLITQMPYDVDIMAVGAFKDASGKESFFHRILKEAGFHRKGEWFEIPDGYARGLAAQINEGDTEPLKDLSAIRGPRTSPQGYGATRSAGGKVHATDGPHGPTICGRGGSAMMRLVMDGSVTYTCGHCLNILLRESPDATT